MADNNSSAKSGGLGFIGALQLLFIGLKLGEVGQVASWSWWGVLAPAWGTLLLVLFFLALFLVGVSVTGIDK